MGSQTTKDATKFYEAKVKDLETNLKDLESIVQGKSNNLRVVEDGKSSQLCRSKISLIVFPIEVLRQKVLSGSTQAAA